MTGCSGDEAQKDITSIADNGIKRSKVPKGCQIIDISEEEIPISWEYNTETDDGQNTHCGAMCADAGDVIYKITSATFLEYYDKNTMTKSLLCGKPDCEHNNEKTCNAYVSGMSALQYYNGYLYTVQDANKLTKISLDGAIREEAGELVVNPVTEVNGGSIRWIIHRGYIYYYYNCGSGYIEGTYYLNNSNCIYRMNLENKEKECIMAFPEMSLSSCIMQGVGSYIYMNMVENEEGVYLYRFNTETKQLERLKSIGSNIEGYAVCDDRLYYLRKNCEEKTMALYCFEYGNKEIKLIDTYYNANGGNMYCDDDFIYADIIQSNISNIKIFDKTGNFIADIALEKEIGSNVLLPMGIDKTRVYFYEIYGGELYYIEKSKLLNGEINIEKSQLKIFADVIVDY